jgi:hypothetical protein
MIKDKSKQLSEKQLERKLQERAVFDGPVQAQRGVLNKVVAQGVTIDFTDRHNDAHKAYKDASKPKEWWKIDGRVTTLVASEVI